MSEKHNPSHASAQPIPPVTVLPERLGSSIDGRKHTGPTPALEAAPKIGVGVFVMRENDSSFIIGTRKGSRGAGTWALPGGHLEHGETFTTCAIREVIEETGIDLAPWRQQIRFFTATTTIFDDGEHYVTIFMGCVVPSDVEPLLMEPEKCHGWEWVGWDYIGKDFIYKPQSDVENIKGVYPFKPMQSLREQRPGFSPREEWHRVSKALYRAEYKES